MGPISLGTLGWPTSHDPAHCLKTQISLLLRVAKDFSRFLSFFLHACLHVCVRACVRACVRVCVCACARVRVRVRFFLLASLSLPLVLPPPPFAAFVGPYVLARKQISLVSGGLIEQQRVIKTCTIRPKVFTCTRASLFRKYSEIKPGLPEQVRVLITSAWVSPYTGHSKRLSGVLNRDLRQYSCDTLCSPIGTRR